MKNETNSMPKNILKFLRKNLVRKKNRLPLRHQKTKRLNKRFNFLVYWFEKHTIIKY